MRSRIICLLFLLFIPLANYAQEITYDTTYQVTYENGVKDSVIIIYKRVVVTEKVYIVDSSGMLKFGYDVFATPIFWGLSKGHSSFSSEGITNNNHVTMHYGQAIGGHFYCKFKKWDLRTGLSLTRHSLKATSKTETQQTVIAIIDKYILIDTYYTVDGDDIIPHSNFDLVKDTVESVQVTNQQKESRLNLYYLNIPVQLGYKAKYKGIDLGFYAGPVMSILLFGSGDALNDRGDLTSDIRHNTEKVMLHLEANLQVGYSFNESIHLFGEPYFQKYMSGFNQHNSIYSSDIMGFRVGMKFSL